MILVRRRDAPSLRLMALEEFDEKFVGPGNHHVLEGPVFLDGLPKGKPSRLHLSDESVEIVSFDSKVMKRAAPGRLGGLVVDKNESAPDLQANATRASDHVVPDDRRIEHGPEESNGCIEIRGKDVGMVETHSHRIAPLGS